MTSTADSGKLQEKRTRRIFAGDDCIAIGLFHCSLHKTALDIAAIDEKVLHGTVGTSGVRLVQCSRARSVPLRSVIRHFNHIGSHFLAEYRRTPVQSACPCRPIENTCLPSRMSDERNLRMRQRRMLYYAEYI